MEIAAIGFFYILTLYMGLGAVTYGVLDIESSNMAAVIIGGVAILLGILFKGMNVSFLVGWAFAVAASANLPSIMMMLFWKKTTSQGITYSILIGAISALILILLSPSMFERYGFDTVNAPILFDNPGIISIPLSFITIIAVSLLTQKNRRHRIFSY